MSELAKLYVVRHGETDWNRCDRILGRTDVPLNETGEAQAREVGRRLAGVPLKAIYSSPLSRTRRTAEIIASYQAVPCGVVPRASLIEQHFGPFEGALRSSEAYQKAKRQFACRWEGGESCLDLAARIYPFLQEVQETFGPEDPVLVVTHGGIGRIIASFFLPMENEAFFTFVQKTGEIRTWLL